MNSIPKSALPHFLTKTMISWLFQYHVDTYNTITKIGRFEWGYIHNKRNPKKPRKKPIIKEYHTLINESFSRSIYFLEENQYTLFVYFVSGFELSGQSVVYQYTWNGTTFLKHPKRILTSIR